MVQREVGGNNAEPIRVEVSEQGIGYIPPGAKVRRLESVSVVNGQRLADLETLSRDSDVGYKWFGSRSDGTDWFFIGTVQQYKQLKQQKTHHVGEYSFTFW